MITQSQITVLCVLPAYRRSQDFVWGALFLAQKVDGLFLVVALKERLEICLQI